MIMTGQENFHLLSSRKC